MPRLPSTRPSRARSIRTAPYILTLVLFLSILPTSVLGASYEVALECLENSKTSDGSNPVYYTITVHNRGTGNDTYTLEPKLVQVTGEDPEPEKWSYEVYPLSLELEPGGSSNIGLTVGSGCGCQIGTTAQVDLHATSTSDPLVTAVISTFTTRGNDGGDEPPPDIPGPYPAPDFRVHLLEDYMVIDPPLGEPLDFTLSFTNLYNGSHPIDLIVLRAPEGWTIELQDTHITLESNGSSTTSFHVTPHVNAIEEVHSVMIRASSSLDDSIRKNVYVNFYLNAELIINGSGYRRASEGWLFWANIENHGSGGATAINVSFIKDGKQLTSTSIGSLSSGERINISAPYSGSLESGAITVKFRADQEGQVGSDGFTIQQIEGDDEPDDSTPIEGSEDGNDHSILVIIIIIALILIIGSLLLVKRRREELRREMEERLERERKEAKKRKNRRTRGKRGKKKRKDRDKND